MPPVNAPAQRTQTTTAPSTPAPNQAATDQSMFDFNSFNKELEQQNQITAARQAEQLAVAQRSADISKRSLALAKDQQDSMGFLRKEVANSQVKMQHARELADSNNPLDTLRLLGLQSMDPNGYLREQREKRLQEDMQQASILNQVFAQGQDALKSELIASQGKLDTLKTLEAIGQEKLTTFATNAKLMHENLSAVQVMKEDAIHGLSDSDITLALGQAKANPKGVTNIGGIDVDVRTLEDRQTDLNERKYNSLVKSTAMQLAQDDAQHVGDTLADREYQRGLNKENRDNAETDRLIRQGKRRGEADAVISQAQERDTRAMSVKELMDLRTHDYKTEGGEQYNPEVVDQAYARKKQAQLDQVTDSVQQNMLDQFDTKALSDENERVSQLAPRYPAGSTLASAAATYQRQVKLAALGSGPENNLVTRLTAVDGFQKAKEQFESATDKQAALDAKGDRTGATYRLRLAYYRGEGVPAGDLHDATVTRLSKFQSISDLYPPKVAATIEKKFRELIQSNKTDAQSFLTGAMNSDEKKAFQADMAQKAIEFGVNQSLDANTTAQIIGNQSLDPSHPLYGKMSPTQVTTFAAQADATAKATWMQDNRLTDEQAAAALAGTPVDGKNSNELVADLRYRENHEFLQLIDGVSPGLGHEVAMWWQDQGAAYVAKVQGAIQAKDAGTFQGNNMNSIAGDLITTQFGQYGSGLAQADGQFQSQMQQRNASLLTFGSDPTNTQIAILSADKSLSDSDRTKIYTDVLQPLLKQANAKGLDYDQTNAFIENQIAAYTPTTPEMKLLMKTMKADRTATIESLHNWRSVMTSTFPFGLKSNYMNGPSTKWFQALNGGPSGEKEKAWKPWIQVGPISIGGDPAAYEAYRKARGLN